MLQKKLLICFQSISLLYLQTNVKEYKIFLSRHIISKFTLSALVEKKLIVRENVTASFLLYKLILYKNHIIITRNVQFLRIKR